MFAREKTQRRRLGGNEARRAPHRPPVPPAPHVAEKIPDKSAKKKPYIDRINSSQYIMSDEKLMEDVAESETGYLEIYVRFNDDFEKDYCFQIKSTATFKDLDRIFTSLPIALRPSIFYERIPVGYQLSTSPGFLTEHGLILFDYDTDKRQFVKNVARSSKISELAWPGQLILPKWQQKTFLLYSIVLLLLVWLYTDLPDFISPTPGLCMTNQVTTGLIWLAEKFDQQKLAQLLFEDLRDPVSIPVQCLFFVLHVIKCAFIFMVLWTGAFNPIGSRHIPLVSKPIRSLAEVTREELLQLGWTGSRRASPDEYKDYFRDYKIKEHGGLVPAHKAGVFENLKNLGVFLGEGEGYNTPLPNNSTLKDLLSPENEKLTLNYEYLATLGEFFERYSETEGVRIQDLIKQYRRYGLLHGNDTIEKIVANRKRFGDAFVKIKK